MANEVSEARCIGFPFAPRQECRGSGHHTPVVQVNAQSLRCAKLFPRTFRSLHDGSVVVPGTTPCKCASHRLEECGADEQIEGRSGRIKAWDGLAGRCSLRNPRIPVVSQRCPMSKTPTHPPDLLDQMSEEFRKIRLNQPLRSSAEMRAQLEMNRSDYAERQLSSSELPSSSGLKKAV